MSDCTWGTVAHLSFMNAEVGGRHFALSLTTTGVEGLTSHLSFAANKPFVGGDFF